MKRNTLLQWLYLTFSVFAMPTDLRTPVQRGSQLLPSPQE